jgi:hypothetical protein
MVEEHYDEALVISLRYGRPACYWNSPSLCGTSGDAIFHVDNFTAAR